MNVAKILEVYFICGTQNITDRSLPEILQDALDAGITCFQYREKGPGSLTNREERKAMAETCLALCRQADVPFFINDDVEMALEIGADGIHVGQDDRPIRETIQLVGGKMMVGLSVTSIAEFKKAQTIDGLDYVGAGPIYGTSTKVDAKQPVGLGLLEEMVAMGSHLPIVAIGGMSESTAVDVHATGVAGVSVISAIANSKDMKQAVQNLKK